MGFSEATITGVNPPTYSGGTMYLSWTTTSPAGTWFQVYINQALAWWGQSTSTRLPNPGASLDRIDVGTVLPAEKTENFASSLPSAPNRFVELNWTGGTFEGADIAGFYVYGSPTAGASVNLVTPIATITAYPGGITLDGFGLGGFGDGGFGQASGNYTYIAGPYTSGVWSFTITPFDSAGNLGTAANISVTVAVPPLRPPIDPSGRRLEYTYNPSDFEVTLTWLASLG